RPRTVPPLAIRARTNRTPPAIRSAYWSLVSHGTKRPRAPAPSTQRTPTQAAKRRTTLIALPPPPFGLERPQREEQREGAGADMVAEILRIDDPAREAVHAVGEGEVLQHGPEGPAGRIRAPADHPGGEQHTEGAEPGDDLVFRQRGDEEPYRQE